MLPQAKFCGWPLQGAMGWCFDINAVIGAPLRSIALIFDPIFSGLIYRALYIVWPFQAVFGRKLGTENQHDQLGQD